MHVSTSKGSVADDALRDFDLLKQRLISCINGVGSDSVQRSVRECESLNLLKQYFVHLVSNTEFPEAILRNSASITGANGRSEHMPPIVIEPWLPMTSRPFHSLELDNIGLAFKDTTHTKANSTVSKSDKSSLHPPGPYHRSKPSISSTGTGASSVMSDHDPRPEELLLTSIDIAAFQVGSKDSYEKFRAFLDTGNLLGAPIIVKSLAKDLQWKSDPNADNPSTCPPHVVVPNGSTMAVIGTVTLATEFRDDDGKAIDKVTVPYWVVPDSGDLPHDCVINWKTILRRRRLREHFATKLMLYPRKLQRVKVLGALQDPSPENVVSF